MVWRRRHLQFCRFAKRLRRKLWLRGTNRSELFSIPATLQVAINYAVTLIAGYTNATIQFAGSDAADIMVAQSSVPNPTSWAYLPDPAFQEGGDVWFGTAYDFSLAAPGNYYFQDALHELGHAFGLKHPDTLDGVANVAVPSAHEEMEYTVMSYRSYVGGTHYRLRQ